MCTWKLETPCTVPAGARISAGYSGSVDRSLPNEALTDVNRSPVSCMPSPESPAKRTTTRSSVGRPVVAGRATPLSCRPIRPWLNSVGHVVQVGVVAVPLLFTTP